MFLLIFYLFFLNLNWFYNIFNNNAIIYFFKNI
jgi:hypothetical protein